MSHTRKKLSEIFAENNPKPVLRCLADVEPRKVSWLWPGRVPLGRITLLAGCPGVGKSFLTIDMVARVTTGTPWPDGSDCPTGSVILVSAEDDPSDTIRPRLDAHYADVRKVHLLSAVRRIGEDGQPYEVLFSLADVAHLETALKALPDCRLVIIDSIDNHLGANVGSSNINQIYPALWPLINLTHRRGVATIFVARSRETKSPFCKLESRALTGLTYAVWHIIRDPKDRTHSRRLFLLDHNALGASVTELAFSITGDPPKVIWDREPVNITPKNWIPRPIIE